MQFASQPMMGPRGTSHAELPVGDLWSFCTSDLLGSKDVVTFVTLHCALCTPVDTEGEYTHSIAPKVPSV